MSTKERYWFKARYDWGAAFDDMSDEQVGQYARILWKYMQTGEEPKSISGIVSLLWKVTMASVAEEEKARLNGLKGAEAKKALQGSARGVQDGFTQRREEKRKEEKRKEEAETEEELLGGYRLSALSAEKEKNVDPDQIYYGILKMYPGQATDEIIRSLRIYMNHVGFNSWDADDQGGIKEWLNRIIQKGNVTVEALLNAIKQTAEEDPENHIERAMELLSNDDSVV